MTEETREVHRDTLKVQALLERISNITTTYENQDAERRVEITILEEKNARLEQELQEARELVQKDTTGEDSGPESTS